MGVIRIKKGLDIPISGTPEMKVQEAKAVKQVAILGEDYVGMKPTFFVKEGDTVKKGQILFEDKKCPGIKYTAPGAGKVVAINRGEKRAFLSLVIQLDANEEQVELKSFSESEIDSLDEETVKNHMLETGFWPILRMRPYGKVANHNEKPNSIFITAMDTNPLAPSVDLIMEGKEEVFELGVKILSKLTEGKIYLCTAQNSKINSANPKVQKNEFVGPHPAGLPGTHIHFLDPVHAKKVVWHVNAEDVARLGELFLTGKINTEKIVALAGPQVKEPRLLKTRLGADINALLEGELKDGKNRVISGSVLEGRKATAERAFLGFYHRQISVISEPSDRKFLGWMNPFENKFALKRVLLSSFNRSKKFDLSADMNGGLRAIVPSGSYETVMPLDILPTFLFRALAVDDVEEAEKLGMLELVEEDVALCTFVSPSKIDYGPILRRNLTLMEKEG